jgi:hypothetical protein
VSKLSRLSNLRRDKNDPLAPDVGPVFSARFIVALVLIALGIAWLAFYYMGVRPTDGWGSFNAEGQENAATGPAFMQDLKGWNYLIGFGLLLLGLAVSAHPSTPLGRGRGVVVGMLGCFVIGLLWICVYYVTQTANPPMDIPIFNDLEQKNLFVGIGFMAVGFTFATRWE